MQKYIDQLLEDIAYATQNICLPFTGSESSLFDWVTAEDEEKLAPTRNLETWTGITTYMLPPEKMLEDAQVIQLLDALIKLLDTCNCHFVMQITVPERIQYAAIRDHFNQEVKLKRLHMGFFELCRHGTPHKTCALGEYCQCAFFAEFFADRIDEERSPGEERAAELEMEIIHIKRKYGDDWMKYYPYHLDKDHDDENGNPYNYGIPDDDEDDRG
ncbi:MAG: hypothetical protein WBO39_17055 [Ferruginibacter sp.]